MICNCYSKCFSKCSILNKIQGSIFWVLCNIISFLTAKLQLSGMHTPRRHTGNCKYSSMHYKEDSVHVHCLATLFLQKETPILLNRRNGGTQYWSTHLEKNLLPLSDIYHLLICPTYTPVTLPNELSQLAKTQFHLQEACKLQYF